MATKRPRPGRTLTVFLLAVVILCGLAAIGGTWSPRLGLDLRGGTRITLTAEQENPNENQMNEAAGIIDSRVNSQGVAETEVSTQGSRNIVVEIPGQNRKDLVDLVKRTAQLRFRLVAASAPGSAKEVKKATQSPSGKATPQQKNQKNQKKQSTQDSTPRNRVAPGSLDADETDSPSPSPQPSKPAASESVQPSEGAQSPAQSPAQPAKPKGKIAQALAWQANPDPVSIQKFISYVCPEKNDKTKLPKDTPGAPLISCDDEGNKYLLSESLIEGTDLKSASFGTPSQGVGWAVQLGFKAGARDTFAEVTQELVQNQKQFAIVLDSTVISAPGVTGVINDGNAEITGDFKEAEAASLANSLKYGALPLRFPEDGIQVEQVGATLAGDQLSAGFIAGGIGLALVMVYCLFYYRGLGTVVIASLAIAAVITYAVVLLLGETAGFTLTLPGIAGLIVAVGITADSFIVYFERVRDEMREGKSMRVAVETGWRQARNTTLAADAVSFLAAIVLYIFAIGVVKGFAFALGISTIIDVTVFFLFTKPMMSLLARRRFFNSGSKFSGLSPETLGIDQPRTPLAQAGGKA